MTVSFLTHVGKLDKCDAVIDPVKTRKTHSVRYCVSYKLNLPLARHLIHTG